MLKTLTLAAVMLLLAGCCCARAQGEPHAGHNMSDPNHWYPIECCSGMDCAPVDTIERVPEWKGRWMTSKHGRAWVPDSKKFFTKKLPNGKDVDFEIPSFEKARTHICIRPPYASDPKPEHGDMHVICLFGESGI